MRIQVRHCERAYSRVPEHQIVIVEMKVENAPTGIGIIVIYIMRFTNVLDVFVED